MSFSLHESARLAEVAAMLAASAMSVTGVACGNDADRRLDPCTSQPALTPAERTTVDEMLLPEALPPARGNAAADDPQAAVLGFKVFYDARFSSNREIRCASCHEPEEYFGDGLAVSRGVAEVTRNSPTLLNVAWLRWFFWDGRADTLWSQPLFAFEAAQEMNYTRLEIAHRLARDYDEPYENVFGALPPLDDDVRFPARGRPTDPEWDGMTPQDQDAVNAVAANLGKALEAYERKLAAGRAPLDAFLLGDEDALSAGSQRGLRVFVRAGCATCHGGPMLTDEGFHNLGVPAQPGIEPDAGRAAGIPVLHGNPFNAMGDFFEGAAPAQLTPGEDPTELVGAIRTPSLRNVGLTAPYGHNGIFPNLPDVVDFHLRGGGRGQGGFAGAVTQDLEAATLCEADRADLLTFLDEALEGEPPDTPWNNWPER